MLVHELLKHFKKQQTWDPSKARLSGQLPFSLSISSNSGYIVWLQRLQTSPFISQRTHRKLTVQIDFSCFFLSCKEGFQSDMVSFLWYQWEAHDICLFHFEQCLHGSGHHPQVPLLHTGFSIHWFEQFVSKVLSAQKLNSVIYFSLRGKRPLSFTEQFLCARNSAWQFSYTLWFVVSQILCILLSF